MKSLFTIVIAILVVLSFSMVGFANTVTTGSQTEKKMGDVKTYNGKVVSFDNATHLLVVKGTVRKETFDVSNAKVSGSLQAGQRVHVTYHKDNGKMIASSVTSGERTAMYHGSDNMRHERGMTH